MFRKLVMLLVTAAAATLAFAQPKLIVSTGGDPKVSTYTRMFNELQATCPGTGLTAIESNGSVQNLDRLAMNQVSGAFVQTDILWLRSRTDKLDNVRTLLALHPEEVHVIVRANGFPAASLNPFASRLQPREMDESRGRKVASWGGSYITLRVINELLRLEWLPTEAPNGKAALELLGKGDVDLVVAVGGHPLPLLNDLKADFRVLGFSVGAVERLKDVYVPASVSYPNMTASMGVTTVATEALLVVQNYRSKTYSTALSSVRKCLSTSIDDLRENLGSHPKWKVVNPTNRGKWNWYEPQ